MPFYSKPSLIISALLLTSSAAFSHAAFAFDPFTLFQGLKAGVDALGGLVGTAGDLSGNLSDLQELYSEVGGDTEVSQEGKKLIDEIKEIESIAYDLGYTAEDIDSLLDNQKKDAKKFSDVIQSLTKAVRAGKKASKLFMRIQDKANHAQVESTQIEREQLVILYKQLELQHQTKLDGVKQKLEEDRQKRRETVSLREEVKKKGGQTFGRSGVLSFPKLEPVIEKAIETAIRLRLPLFAAMLFVFLMRVIFYQFGFFGKEAYGQLMRDVILCSLLMATFPEIIRGSIAICSNIATSIGYGNLQDIIPKKFDFSEVAGMMMKRKISFEWVIQWIKYLAFITASFVTNFGMAFLIVLFPVIIFASQMLSFTIAWPFFMAGFLSLTLWPMFWNLIGYLASALWVTHQQTFADAIQSVLFSILQLISPMIGLALLKGQSLSKSIGASIQTVGQTLSTVKQQFQSPQLSSHFKPGGTRTRVPAWQSASSSHPGDSAHSPGRNISKTRPRTQSHAAPRQEMKSEATPIQSGPVPSGRSQNLPGANPIRERPIDLSQAGLTRGNQTGRKPPGPLKPKGSV